MSFGYNGVRETYGFHHFQVRDVKCQMIVNWRDSQAGKKKCDPLFVLRPPSHQDGNGLKASKAI